MNKGQGVFVQFCDVNLWGEESKDVEVLFFYGIICNGVIYWVVRVYIMVMEQDVMGVIFVWRSLRWLQGFYGDDVQVVREVVLQWCEICIYVIVQCCCLNVSKWLWSVEK